MKTGKDITQMSAACLAGHLRKKEVSAVEAAKAYLAAADEADVGAWLCRTDESALAAAEVVDKKRLAGEELAPLAGVPMGVKDNICTKGVPTTCASKMLEGFVPTYNATVVERLQQQDAVVLGKLNMDEFAMGSSTENSAFGPAQNPRCPGRVPGGSSGGSAAAVAANQAAYALGSDTGGSIRQPAAFCGLVGLKPTYGAVSRYGLIAFASSLDQIGPLAKTVEDAALVYTALSAHDERDSTSVPGRRQSCLAGLDAGARGLRMALPKQLLGAGVQAGVKARVLAAAKLYEGMGAVVEEVDMPVLPDALPAYYVISSAEASSNLARFDGVRYGHRAQSYTGTEELYKNSRSGGFGPEVKRRIMLGTFALSAGYYDAYYNKALQVRTLLMEQFAAAFERYDILLSPTAPTGPWRFGEKSGAAAMYMGDVCTVPASIAGLPALSVPCGSTEDGLPVGLQLVGRAFSEGLLLQAGKALETALGGEAK